MKSQIFILIATVLLLSSCAQISSLQTAKTLPKGASILGGNIALYGVTGDDFIGGELGNIVLPHVEVFGRQGFAKNFDVGLKLSTSANLAIDGKYQFHGDQASKFAMAIGAAFEYQFNSTDNFISRQIIPLYFSFHPNDSFALYASPKFIHQWVVNNDNIIFLGSNIGLKKRLTPRFSLIAEGSNFYVFDSQFNISDEIIYQAGIGFLFDIR